MHPPLVMHAHLSLGSYLRMVKMDQDMQGKKLGIDNFVLKQYQRKCMFSCLVSAQGR